MRHLLLATMLLLPAPLFAQRVQIEPAPSALFGRPAVADTTHQDPHPSIVKAGVRGLAIGAAVGVGVGLLTEGARGSGEDPGLAPILFGVVGAVVGFVVGASFADHHGP